MIQAMYSGISGMKAFKSSLDVIGNNIANVNTTAYKSSRATFKEMLSQTIRSASSPAGGRGGINPSQVGLGVFIGSVDVNQTQGSMTSTGKSTDLAIEGNGYFALGDGQRVSYTRDGSFCIDPEYALVASATGLRVLGWTSDPATGLIDTAAPLTAASKIEIPVGGLSLARQTSSTELGGNLDAAAAIGTSCDVQFYIYDSLGVSHQVTVNFTKAANQVAPPNQATWDYSVSCPDAGAAPVATGSLTFDSLGYSEVDSVPISLTFTSPNGATQPLEFDLDTQKVCQLNGAKTVDMTYQDGLAMGTLEGFGIDRSGLVSGTFTNGAVRPLAQMALASFNNPSGLTKTGNSTLSESPNSGAAKMNLPGVGGVGLISSGSLESSNVDLANEFTSMIVAQRGFQANSRVITVSDEILQDLVSMKR